ncbi:MAG: DUF4105 domain-containing protein [Lactobacillaceae bacterium]|jgi:hypothetical protein|nr:DUF4105 domain-containing protein [Lactobacillaceae bacterium]
MLRCCFIVFLVLITFVKQSFALEVDEFAYSKDWLAVVHYQEKMFGGYKSSIDSDSFFVSGEGKTNPKKELEETIELFNSANVSRICHFPARHKLLTKHGFIDAKYPKCADYNSFYSDLRPSGVTLLFTDAYMNNPSSLFGHTLLRIDTSRKGTQLLAHGVNYGAFVDEETANPMLFAVYGLTGGYMGGFTVKPYYDIINLYNNIENRDIWEFGLDLTSYELDLFVAHLWELGHSQTPYYFFTKNCSYMLMELLDAVRPELELSKEFPLHTIPFDTVRVVDSREGMIKTVNYRPSRQSKIKNQYEQMNSRQKKALLRIVKDSEYNFEELNDEEKAGVIETAYQFVQYQNVEKILTRTEYREKSFTLLKERSNLKSEANYEPLEKGETLIKAHKSARLSLGVGSRNGENFQEIMFRPAYHSLIDNTYAYLKGAEINFLNITARHYDNGNKYVLNNVDLAGIKSLSPRDSLFKPISYTINASIDREMNPVSEEEGYVFNLKGGAGAAYELHKRLWVFMLLNAQVAYGGFLERNQWAGTGLGAGVISDFGDFRIILGAENMFATSKYASKMKYNAEAAYSITENFYVSAGYNYWDNYGKDINEVKFSIKYHF